MRSIARAIVTWGAGREPWQKPASQIRLEDIRGINPPERIPGPGSAFDPLPGLQETERRLHRLSSRLATGTAPKRRSEPIRAKLLEKLARTVTGTTSSSPHAAPGLRSSLQEARALASQAQDEFAAMNGYGEQAFLEYAERNLRSARALLQMAEAKAPPRAPGKTSPCERLIEDLPGFPSATTRNSMQREARALFQEQLREVLRRLEMNRPAGLPRCLEPDDAFRLVYESLVLTFANRPEAEQGGIQPAWRALAVLANPAISNFDLLAPGQETVSPDGRVSEAQRFLDMLAVTPCGGELLLRLRPASPLVHTPDPIDYAESRDLPIHVLMTVNRLLRRAKDPAKEPLSKVGRHLLESARVAAWKALGLDAASATDEQGLAYIAVLNGFVKTGPGSPIQQADAVLSQLAAWTRAEDEPSSNRFMRRVRSLFPNTKSAFSAVPLIDEIDAGYAGDLGQARKKFDELLINVASALHDTVARLAQANISDLDLLAYVAAARASARRRSDQRPEHRTLGGGIRDTEGLDAAVRQELSSLLEDWGIPDVQPDSRRLASSELRRPLLADHVIAAAEQVEALVAHAGGASPLPEFVNRSVHTLRVRSEGLKRFLDRSPPSAASRKDLSETLSRFVERQVRHQSLKVSRTKQRGIDSKFFAVATELSEAMGGLTMTPLPHLGKYREEISSVSVALGSDGGRIIIGVPQDEEGNPDRLERTGVTREKGGSIVATAGLAPFRLGVRGGFRSEREQSQRILLQLLDPYGKSTTAQALLDQLIGGSEPPTAELEAMAASLGIPPRLAQIFMRFPHVSVGLAKEDVEGARSISTIGVGTRLGFAHAGLGTAALEVKKTTTTTRVEPFTGLATRATTERTNEFAMNTTRNAGGSATALHTSISGQPTDVRLATPAASHLKGMRSMEGPNASVRIIRHAGRISPELSRLEFSYSSFGDFRQQVDSRRHEWIDRGGDALDSPRYAELRAGGLSERDAAGMMLDHVLGEFERTSSRDGHTIYTESYRLTKDAASALERIHGELAYLEHRMAMLDDAVGANGWRAVRPQRARREELARRRENLNREWNDLLVSADSWKPHELTAIARSSASRSAILDVFYRSITKVTAKAGSPLLKWPS